MEPFLGEIRAFSFNVVPKGWAACDGRLLPISQNQALFSLLGTTFGGDGTTNFALPNLQASTPVDQRGTAGPMGTSRGGAGPTQQYLTVLYAIAIHSTVFPGR